MEEDRRTPSPPDVTEVHWITEEECRADALRFLEEGRPVDEVLRANLNKALQLTEEELPLAERGLIRYVVNAGFLYSLDRDRWLEAAGLDERFIERPTVREALLDLARKDLETIHRPYARGIWFQLAEAFPSLGSEIALAAFKEYPVELHVRMSHFRDLGPDVATTLLDAIERGDSGWTVHDFVRELRAFSRLTTDVARRLVERGFAHLVVPSLADRFSPEDQNAVLCLMLRHLDGSEVFPFVLQHMNVLTRCSGFTRDAYAWLRAKQSVLKKEDVPQLLSYFEGLPAGSELSEAVIAALESKDGQARTRESEEYPYALELAMRDPSPTTIRVIPKLATARSEYSISPIDLLGLAEEHPEFLDRVPSSQVIVEALVAPMKTTMDMETRLIAADMEWVGREIGWSSALRIANRPMLSPHGAYRFVAPFKKFVLVGNPGLVSPKELVSLLDQVARDDARYESGVSQVEFHEVLAKIGGSNVAIVLEEVDAVGVPALRERTRRLREDERFHPIKSWKGMKEFAVLVELVNRRETLDALTNSEAPPAVRDFALALLEHPNVPANVVLKFLQDPAEFLSATGEYTDESIQERASPINLAQVERLGLTAAEVRDALVDGTLDRLQELPAFERAYRLDREGRAEFSQEFVRAAAARAIGRPREGAPGEAANGRGLFDAIRSAFARHGIGQENLTPWLRGEAMLPVWSEELAAALDGLVFGALGVPRPPMFDVRVRIGKKSDPSLVVAGDDTASCMKFGDGKTNVYAWNPACAQMVVERRMENGIWRTMAQSVVVPSVAGDAPSPDRFARLLGIDRPGDAISASELARQTVLLCDNIEPNPNDESEGRMPVVEGAYARFFTEYLQAHAADIGVDPTRVAVGKEAYITNRDRVRFPRTPNVYLPVVPLSYTDNGSDESFLIETGLPPAPAVPTAGIRSAKGTDVLAMAYVASRAFAGKTEMLPGVFKAQHSLVGALISREQHGDPALTLIATDAAGEPVGYTLAYVGHASDVPEVFIDGFAVNPDKKLLAVRDATRLLDAMLDRYVTHYESRGEPFPSIFSQMREGTSYRLFMNQLETLSARRGIRAEVVEEFVFYMDGEPFHALRVYVGKTDAEIATAKERWKNATWNT